MEKTLRIIEMTWKGSNVLLMDGNPESGGLGHSIRGRLEGLSWHIPADYYTAGRKVPFIRADVIPFNDNEINETFADSIAAGNVTLSDDKHFIVDFDPITLSFIKLDKNYNRI